MGDDRGKIMEKRSSMRSWHERGERKPRQNEMLGIGLVVVIFLVVIASAFTGNGGQDPKPGESSQEETPVPTTVPPEEAPAPEETPSAISPAFIPAPSIRISSPQNITYDTGTPQLDFTVAGSGLNTVLLSIDGGENITVPHDGTLAKIDFARGNPLFIEDFSAGAERWTEDGDWYVEGGEYVTTGGTSSFGDANWDDYIMEVNQRMTSGRASAVGIKWDGGKNKYYIQTHDTYGSLDLFKFDKDGYTSLTATELVGVVQNDWYIWKITAIDSKIQVFIDDTQYIEYDDYIPYLKGSGQLSSWGDSTVKYDYVHVYKPLSNAPHNLTLFTNNTAGNASATTVFFTVNATAASTGDEEKISGMKETMSKSGLNVTLDRFDIYKEIYVYPAVYKRSQYEDTKMVSALTLTIKNTGDTEKPFKLDPYAVILDEHGNQYGMQIYSYMKNSAGLDDQIEQTTIYPGVERQGIIYFEPNVKISAKKVTLFLYINGAKYEFAFSPFL